MLRACCTLILLCSAAITSAQELSLEAIFSRHGLAGPAPQQLRWSPDGRVLTYILEAAESGERNLWAVGAEAGEPQILVDHLQLSSLAPALRDATDDERERERRSRYAVASYLWSPDSRSLLFTSAGSLFHFDIDRGVASEITPGLIGVKHPQFAPDGKRVSFVHNFDLWMVDLEGGEPWRLTSGGTPDLLHGDLDWVYPEEFGVRRGYQWSPDSARIVFLETDQSEVPTYPLASLARSPATVDLQRYPKPGDSNPEVRLGVIEVGERRPEPKWFEFNVEYLPRFSWAGPTQLIVQTLDRPQRNLRVESINIVSSRRSTLWTERDTDWINIHDDLRVLGGGEQLLWSSERSGLRHLYVYSRGGELVRRLTDGDWTVSAVAGVDEVAGIVYFTANRDNPIGTDLYAVQLTGGPVRRVSSGIGTHRVVMNAGATQYVDARSTLSSAGAVVVRSPGGAPARVIHESRSLEGAEFVIPELATLQADDGATVRTMLLKPTRLARGKQYPLVVYVYSGPNVPTIRDAWDSRGRYAFHQRLVQQGFIVAYVDDRASSLMGHEYEAALSRNYGPVALADQLKAVEAFAELPFVDSDRIGIWGWSGGGFATAFAMTHSDLFRAGIAVAPVTDWRLYDSIYTERYMGLPRDEAAAYRRTSAVEAAADLQGRLMLVHGTADDNVHPQNTFQMVDALIDAGKPYELQLYPGQTHGISSEKDRLHLFRTMEEFWVRQLRDEESR